MVMVCVVWLGGCGVWFGISVIIVFVVWVRKGRVWSRGRVISCRFLGVLGLSWDS